MIVSGPSTAPWWCSHDLVEYLSQSIGQHPFTEIFKEEHKSTLSVTSSLFMILVIDDSSLIYLSVGTQMFVCGGILYGHLKHKCFCIIQCYWQGSLLLVSSTDIKVIMWQQWRKGIVHYLTPPLSPGKNTHFQPFFYINWKRSSKKPSCFLFPFISPLFWFYLLPFTLFQFSINIFLKK